MTIVHMLNANLRFMFSKQTLVLASMEDFEDRKGDMTAKIEIPNNCLEK